MKFLIIRLSSLGDVIHSLPIVSKLRQEYPYAQIDWLTSKKCFQLLSLIKELNKVYTVNLKNILLIQKQKYDFVIDVQGLLKSAFLGKISLGKQLIGFKNAREFAHAFYDKKINVGSLFNTKTHVVDLNLNLISGLVMDTNGKVKFLIPKLLEPSNNKALNWLTMKQNFKSVPSVVIFPISRWESKMWPMKYWIQLLRVISKSFKVFLCGAKEDLSKVEQLNKELASSNLNCENLIGKTNVKDLIYLIQNSSLAIGMDSFGLHLASAIKNDYGSPEVIGIYGPTSPYRNGPYKLIQNCLYLSELECISCRKKICPLGHHKCMNDIVPSYLEKTIFSLIALRFS